MTTIKRAEQKHPGLTNEDFDYLGEYVRDLADRMGLRDWLINLLYEPSDHVKGHEDSGASIEPVWGKKCAALRVSTDFQSERPERQVQFLCHEMAHLIVDDIANLTFQNENLRTSMGEMFWHGWVTPVKLTFEKAVDHMADILYRHQPPLDWPSQRKPKPKANAKRSRRH